MFFSVSDRTFDREVLSSSQPVLVHFWAPWCGLCRMLNPILLNMGSELERPIKLVSINADENFKLANTYRLKNLPTLILFERGILLGRLDDFHQREGLETTIKKLLDNVMARSV